MIDFGSIAHWWNARTVRERALLGVLAVTLALVVAWSGVAVPLSRMSANAEAHYARAAQQLADVEAAVKEIAAMESGRARIGLAEAVVQSAAASGLALDGRPVENAREITISTQRADSSALFPWIQSLQKDYGIIVTNLTAARNGDGTLKAELRLARGGE